MQQKRIVWWNNALSKFQNKTAYFFKDLYLLEQALTHSSYAHESGLSSCNERLEFLGDSVLELCVSQFLYESYPSSDEGNLTRLRSNLVCKSALSKWALELGIPELLRLGKGLARIRNKDPESRVIRSLSADSLEAFLGALFLDGGYPAAFPLIKTHISGSYKIPDSEVFIDPKSRLQSLTQEKGWGKPSYRLVNVSGEDHMPYFEILVKVGDNIIGTGKGPSRKSAEFRAASEGLKHLL